MVYSKARLTEALTIIKEDKLNKSQIAAEKVAKYCYRDKFNLRRPNKDSASRGVVELYRDGKSDNEDDDEYQPARLKTRKRKTRSTRKPRSSDQASAKKSRVEKTLVEEEPQPESGTQTQIEPDPVGFPIDFEETLVSLSDHGLAFLEWHKSHPSKVGEYLDSQEEEWFHETDGRWQLFVDRFNRVLNHVSNAEMIARLAMQKDANEGQFCPYLQGLDDILFGRWHHDAKQHFHTLMNGLLEEQANQDRMMREARAIHNGIEMSVDGDDTDDEIQENNHNVRINGCLSPVVTDAGPAKMNKIMYNGLAKSLSNVEITGSALEQSPTISRMSGRAGSVANPIDVESPIVVDDHEQERGTLGRTYKATTIETSFAHPILFKQAQRPCNFCREYRFALKGHGAPRRVRVTVTDEKQGINGDGGSGSGSFLYPKSYTELPDGGGFTTNTNPQHHHAPTSTKMCLSCTNRRIMILQCRTHMFNRIPHAVKFCKALFASPSRHLLDQYRADLRRLDGARFGQENRSPPHPLTKWPLCSLCEDPAMFQCVKYQPRTLDGALARIPGISNHQRIDVRREICKRRADFHLSTGRFQSSSSSSPPPPLPPPQSMPTTAIDLADPVQGCGLKLCDFCHHVVERSTATSTTGGGGLVLRRDQIFQAMDKFDRSEYRRADAEFLFEGGLLYNSC